jgi:hypothetical protein
MCDPRKPFAKGFTFHWDDEETVPTGAEQQRPFISASGLTPGAGHAGIPGSGVTELGINQGLNGLHSMRTAVTFLTTIIAIGVAMMIIALPLMEWTWFSSWQTYRFLIPAVLGALILPFVLYAAARNLTRVYTFHLIVIGVWFLILLALTIWSLVDLFWACPTNLEDFCTNTIDPTIEIGYWFFSISVWLQTVLYIGELIVMGTARKHATRLRVIFGLPEHALAVMMLDNVPGGVSRYVKGIGMQSMTV